MKFRRIVVCLLIAAGANLIAAQKKMPAPISESAPEPVIYTGDLQPDKAHFDGTIPHAAGVHHYQAFRANRTHPSEPGTAGWTYNHQPYLAYWNSKFYLEYLSGLTQEHTPPTRTLLTSSSDGIAWNNPIVVFPEYDLPEIKGADFVIPAGTKSVMHQRMGFYVAPNGRLLVLGFYGYSATPRNSPNAGNGLGRVVREYRKDGSLGPIYFIRYNRHAGWSEKNTSYPFYRTSTDAGFLEACEALLADKLITLQWWEEDRGKDGFFTINPEEVPGAAYFSSEMTTSAGAGKAFCFYTRPDGVVVGLWKNQYSALSPDHGKTWTKIGRNKTLSDAGAKTWGQKTKDGRYVIIQNQSATNRNRFPMIAMVGEDGHLFDRMFCIRGEIPDMRYEGSYKNAGPQYFRGIVEGNGDPPGNDTWITYSVNKEDIWVARISVPITGTVSTELDETFESASSIRDLAGWNLYIPRWAPISVVYDTAAKSRCMELRDEEPYDYALAERLFPKGIAKEISFDVKIGAITQGHALEIEVQDQRGGRPLKLRLDKDWLGFDLKRTVMPNPVPIEPGTWHHVSLNIDTMTGTYDFVLDGRLAKKKIPFEEKVSSVERIVFRTGAYRGYVPMELAESGESVGGIGLALEDRPGAGDKVAACSYRIDNLVTRDLGQATTEKR